MSKSDGSTADYYELPAGCTELQDLISHRDLNAQLGEIFRACYRYGHASHSDKMRDAKKIRFYAEAEIRRLEKLERQKAGWTDDAIQAAAFPCDKPVRGVYVDPYDDFGAPLPLEPAASIDDDSARMQAIGQNGNDGDGSGWINWAGGKCPKIKGRRVEILLRSGDIVRTGSYGAHRHTEYNWHHTGKHAAWEIVAYRTAKEAI